MNIYTYIIDQFEHQPWEYTGIDLDEEEEDFEDEDDDPTIPGGGRKNFGETRHFCPVTLKERRILHPGTPEAAVRYREQTYFFVSTDARAQFLENPDMFLSDGKPLQVRLDCHYYIALLQLQVPLKLTSIT